jgi:hypothetical protein
MTVYKLLYQPRNAAKVTKSSSTFILIDHSFTNDFRGLVRFVSSVSSSKNVLPSLEEQKVISNCGE